MDWRCEWCGKPHESNDPPCDNCGHGSFEKAVVRQTDLTEEGPESTKLWVCTECGREHTKHSPPCGRCGAANLELQETAVDESELSAPGYLDLLTPAYAVALVLVIFLAGYFVVGVTGLANVPGFPADGPPQVDAPGNESSLDGVALADVEGAYLDGYNDRRVDTGSDRLERTDGLDDIATYYNKRWVVAEYEDGQLPPDRELSELLRTECERQPVLLTFPHDSPGDADADGLADDILIEWVGPDNRGLDRPGDVTGVDIHAAPNGRLYVTQVLC